MPNSTQTSLQQIIFEAQFSKHNAHLVQFFKTDAENVQALVEYVAAGILNDDGIVIVASQTHILSMLKSLKEKNIEFQSLVDSKQLLLLDAEDTLKTILVRDRPSRRLFQHQVGPLLKDITTRFKKVRIYGEMVNILMDKKNFDGAMTLESFWNEIGLQYSFALFCGYSVDYFSGDLQSVAATQVCSCHSHWIYSPNEINPLGA